MTKIETIVGGFTQPSGKLGYVLTIPEEARSLFPPTGNPNIRFVIKNNNNENWVWVSKRHTAVKLDHIHVTATPWWRGLNPQPKIGVTVVIEVTELAGVREYRL